MNKTLESLTNNDSSNQSDPENQDGSALDLATTEPKGSQENPDQDNPDNIILGYN